MRGGALAAEAEGFEELGAVGEGLAGVFGQLGGVVAQGLDGEGDGLGGVLGLAGLARLVDLGGLGGGEDGLGVGDDGGVEAAGVVEEVGALGEGAPEAVGGGEECRAGLGDGVAEAEGRVAVGAPGWARRVRRRWAT